MTRIPPAATAAALSALLLLGLWWGAVSGGIDSFDALARNGVHSLASPMLTRAMRGITLLGASAIQMPLGAVICFFLWRMGRGRAAALFAISAMGGQLFSESLKLAFHRARPEAFFDYPLPSTYSFPSGHAVAAATFFGVLAAIVSTQARRARTALLWTVAATLAFLVGLSRVYLGVHHASDVLAGYAAAVIWVSAVHSVAKRVRRRRPVAQHT